MEKTRVVVYDSSIHMAGIAASLRTDPTLDVVGIHRSAAGSEQYLTEIGPAVIVFDIGDSSPDLYITLLRNRPCLLLIGVDQSSDAVLVLSCREHQVLAAADLIKIIHRQFVESEAATKSKI